MIHPQSLMELTGFQMALHCFPVDMVAAPFCVLVDLWNEEITHAIDTIPLRHSVSGLRVLVAL